VERIIVGGVHAVNVNASSHTVSTTSKLLPHCSVMVYSLLFMPSSLCMPYDLGVEDEF
jgi:hypothetical protein